VIVRQDLDQAAISATNGSPRREAINTSEHGTNAGSPVSEVDAGSYDDEGNGP
jgi:hypothetical protein